MAEFRFQVPEDQLPSFVATLALGTLRAIAKGALASEEGIWALAAPRMWQPLAGRSGALDEVVDVLKECDELAALEEAVPEELAPTIQRLVDRLEAFLATQPPWQGSWTHD